MVVIISFTNIFVPSFCLQVSGKSILLEQAPYTMSYVSFFFSFHSKIPFRFDLEWGETTVGYRPPWIRQWYVECYRFCNKFVVRCNGSITRGVLFSGNENFRIHREIGCLFVYSDSFHFVLCFQFCCAASVVIFTLCLFSKLWHNWKCNLNWCWMLISVHTNSLHVCRMFVTIVCCRYKKKWCTINMQRICRVNSGIHGIRCCYQVSHLCIT